MSYQLSPERREYADGLEVVPQPPTLEPVAVPQGLEVALSEDPEWNGTEDAGSKAGKGEQDNEAGVAHDATPRPLWRRKRFLIGISAIIVIAVALGVGLGVGLGSQKETESGPEGEGADEPNELCGGGTCPLTITTSKHGPELYVFARTSNDSIAYRARDSGAVWGGWVNLGSASASFSSQPRALNWGVRDRGTDESLFTRLDVFAIGTDNVVYNRWRSDDEDWEDNDWVNVGENVGSLMSVCSPRNSSLNLWGTAKDTDHITHSWWEQKKKEDISSEGLEGITEEQGRYRETGGGKWRYELRYASSALHCISRPQADAYYDVAYYANDSKQATVASFTRSERKWTYLPLEDGDWVGDPYVFGPEDRDEWHFFGVQSNKEVYHQSWTPDSFPPMKSLGGSIISQPAAATLGDDTLDIVALGTNGTLQHLFFDGDGWEETWEDLGIEAWSAPSLRVHNDQVVLLAIGRNGSLQAWTRDNSTEPLWKGSLVRENLGGDLSLGFL